MEPPSTLTEEQRRRIEENRQRALQLLKAKAAQNLNLEEKYMDPSWHSLLSAEFKKEYFAKLKAFLEAEHRSGARVFPPGR